MTIEEFAADFAKEIAAVCNKHESLWSLVSSRPYGMAFEDLAVSTLTSTALLMWRERGDREQFVWFVRHQWGAMPPKGAVQ